MSAALAIPILGQVLAPVINIIGNVLDRTITDKNAVARANEEIQKALLTSALNGELAQLEINKIEAGSSSRWVSGWRPFIGWVCGCALAFEYLIAPILMWIAASWGYTIPPPPPLDKVLWELMFGLLGFGTMRTVEKIKRVAS